MPQTFSLEDVILAALECRLADLNTAGFGTVVSYDKARQTADIQPSVKSGYVNETGERVVERLPVIWSVPVMCPRFGAFRIVGDLKAGDNVLLVHLHHSRDRWQSEGGEVDPGHDERHTLNDCVAIPGLGSLKASFKKYPIGDGISIGHDESGPTIELEPGAIKLGSADADEPVPLGNALKDSINDMVDAIVGPLTGLLSLDPTAAAALAAAVIIFKTRWNTVLSLKVKAE